LVVGDGVRLIGDQAESCPQADPLDQPLLPLVLDPLALD